MEIPVLNEIMRDTVVEVDLDRIAFNVRQIKAMAGPGTQVAAVVKADGYGHGALGIAPAIMENGACLLAVSTLSEAVELKQAYPGYPVLIMGLTPDRLLPYVLEYGIIQTIDTLAQARLLNRLASEKSSRLSYISNTTPVFTASDSRTVRKAWMKYGKSAPCPG